MVRGQHHHVSARYLHHTPSPLLEDHRTLDNGAIVKRLIGLAMAHPVSVQEALSANQDAAELPGQLSMPALSEPVRISP
jgi:hypothetical protein